VAVSQDMERCSLGPAQAPDRCDSPGRTDGGTRPGAVYARRGKLAYHDVWGPDPLPMRVLTRKHARCSKRWGPGSFILRVRTFT
jgi:hypothetical protein